MLYSLYYSIRNSKSVWELNLRLFRCLVKSLRNTAQRLNVKCNFLVCLFKVGNGTGHRRSLLNEEKVSFSRRYAHNVVNVIEKKVSVEVGIEPANSVRCYSARLWVSGGDFLPVRCRFVIPRSQYRFGVVHLSTDVIPSPVHWTHTYKQIITRYLLYVIEFLI